MVTDTSDQETTTQEPKVSALNAKVLIGIRREKVRGENEDIYI